VPIIMPQSVYNIAIKDFTFALSGLFIYGTLPLGPVGSLEYQAYVGATNNTTFGDGIDLRNKRTEGGQLIWETPLWGLRLGATIGHTVMSVDTELDLDLETVQALTAQGFFPSDFNGLITISYTNLIGITWFLEYNAYDVLVTVEYSRRNGDTKSNVDFLHMPGMHDEGFYALAAYRFLDWLQVGAYYSIFHPLVHDRKGTSEAFKFSHEAWERDLALTIRFDVKEFWLFKLEGHYMDGTANLTSPTSSVSSITNSEGLERRFGLFLVKTTLSF